MVPLRRSLVSSLLVLVFVASFVQGATVPAPIEELRVPDGGRFGSALDVDADRMVVGAPFDDTRGTDSGAVHVFERQVTGWVETQKILSWAGIEDGLFGRHVALSGDWLLVGAPQEPHSSGEGWIYFYRFDGTAWKPAQFFNGAGYGRHIALSGDTAFIGRPGDGAKGPVAGSVTVYRLIGGTWFWQGELYAGDARPHQGFGFAIDIDGDTALVTAPLGDAGYVFTRSRHAWTETAKVRVATPAMRLFGLSGAVDGDTLVLASPNDRLETPLGTFTGSVAVFTTDGGGWTQVATLRTARPEPPNSFGTSLGLEGNLLVVGAPQYDGLTQEGIGAAYVYVGSGASWAQQATLTAVQTHPFDAYGSAVVVHDDRIHVGAPGDDGTMTDGGALFGYARAALGL